MFSPTVLSLDSRTVKGSFDIIYAARFLSSRQLGGSGTAGERSREAYEAGEEITFFWERQRGNVEPGEYEHGTDDKGTMFLHDEESWTKMWGIGG